MTGSLAMTRPSLASELWSAFRSTADAREVNLDASLRGRPVEIDAEIHSALRETMDVVLHSARAALELHHLALELVYLETALQVRVEHDGTLEQNARAAIENGVLAQFERVGALGGSLTLSAGRGFGLRVELTLPYGAGANPDAASGMSPPRAASSLAVVPSMPVERLTTQESAVLSLLSAGFSNKEIAGRMHLSVGTVKFHLAQIYQKLGVQGRGRGAAVARARELGLIFD